MRFLTLIRILVAFMSVSGTTGGEQPNNDVEKSFSKIAVELEAQLHSKYFQEFSDFINSEEFDALLDSQEQKAKISKRNARFYIAGFIRGVSDYCDTKILLRGDGHANRATVSRWSVKNDENAGYLEGSKLGKEHGNKLFERLAGEIKEKLKKKADLDR